jgi:phage regulator Rha-like protein
MNAEEWKNVADAMRNALLEREKLVEKYIDENEKLHEQINELNQKINLISLQNRTMIDS